MPSMDESMATNPLNVAAVNVLMMAKLVVPIES
jgi:hypothetical protein